MEIKKKRLTELHLTEYQLLHDSVHQGIDAVMTWHLERTGDYGRGEGREHKGAGRRAAVK